MAELKAQLTGSNLVSWRGMKSGNYLVSLMDIQEVEKSVALMGN